MMDLCTPAIVYLVFSILVFLFDLVTTKVNIITAVIRLLFIGLITYGFNYICNKYSVRASWYTLAFIFLLLPVLLVMATMLIK